MTQNQWSAVRYIGTVLMTVAIASQQQYPQFHWLSVVIAVLGVIGFHAVPTSQQLLPPQSLLDQLKTLGASLERATNPTMSVSIDSGKVVRTPTSTPVKEGAVLPDGSFPIHSPMSDTS